MQEYGRPLVPPLYEAAYALAALLAAPLIAPFLALVMVARLLQQVPPPLPLVPLAPGEYVQLRVERGVVKADPADPPEYQQPPVPVLLPPPQPPQQAEERRPTAEARVEYGAYQRPGTRTYVFEIPAGRLEGVYTVVRAVGPGRLREALITSRDPTIRIDLQVDGRPALPIHSDLQQLRQQTQYLTYVNVFEDPGVGWRIHIGELNFTRSLLLRLYGSSGRVEGTAVVDAAAVVGVS